MLHVHHANRTEALAEALFARLPGPGDAAALFEAPVVVVPHLAMRRWLTLQMARREGIAAHVGFTFLSRWLWSLVEGQAVPAGELGATAPDTAAGALRAAPLLGWRVWAALGDLAFVDAHPRLARYLQSADDAMRLDLAQRVATLFENYAAWRPQWLQRWAEDRATGDEPADAHPDAPWQAALWRWLLADEAARTAAGRAGRAATSLADALVHADQAGQALRARGRQAVHLFALPALAPLHLDWLLRLARHAELHLYVLNPCREHWFEIVSARRLARLAARGRAQAHEVGHRLLAGWGEAAQVQLGRLLDAAGDGVEEHEHFVEPEGPTLLATLQRAVLDMAEPAPGSLRLAEADRSIELHVAHSLTRELEVLHERLLALLASPGGPAPGEVVVLLPDLEAAAPLIDAVFGTAPPARRVPYAVTGLPRHRVDPPARALLALMALAGSRLPVSEVFALLQGPPVAARFGLDDDALDRLQGWVADAGIHWGWDEGPQGWDAGLQRLFLGHAMGPDDGGAPFAGLLPAGRAEGLQAAALGGLWRFVEALRGFTQRAAVPKTATRWAALLHAAVDTFLAPGGTTPAERLEQAEQLQALHRAIGRLVEVWRGAGLADDAAEPLPLAAVQAALEQQLADPARGALPGGAVTFSALAPLRGLPYEVVCVLGLDDGVFPGGSRPAEFDLVAAAPQRGDRQRRLDERQLFLDLVLSARRVLHLSHTGRSARDNTPRPPSVLVAELVEHLVELTAADPLSSDARAVARARLVVEHPLQPFALSAFTAGGDPRVRSHDAELAAALRDSLRARAAASRPSAGTAFEGEASEDDRDAPDAPDSPSAPLFATALPVPGDEWRRVDAATLARGLRHPARLLLQRRLGLAMPQPREALDDDEPLLPDRDARRALADRLLPALLAAPGALPDDAALAARARALPDWPAGTLGEAALADELALLRRFAQRVHAATAAPPLRLEPPPVARCALPAEGDDGPWVFESALPPLRAPGHVGFTPRRRGAADLLSAWIDHLALCLAAPPGVARHTRWLTLDGAFALREVADPARELGALLALWRRALVRPLPLFPRAAWAYVEEGETAARRAFEPRPDAPFNAGADPWVQLAFRGQGDPLGDEFQRIAQVVFGPLREHLDLERS